MLNQPTPLNLGSTFQSATAAAAASAPTAPRGPAPARKLEGREVSTSHSLEFEAVKNLAGNQFRAFQVGDTVHIFSAKEEIPEGFTASKTDQVMKEIVLSSTKSTDEAKTIYEEVTNGMTVKDGFLVTHHENIDYNLGIKPAQLLAMIQTSEKVKDAVPPQFLVHSGRTQQEFIVSSNRVHIVHKQEAHLTSGGVGFIYLGHETM